MKNTKLVARICMLTLALLLALLGTAAAESTTNRYEEVGIAVTFDSELTEKGFGIYADIYDDHENMYLSFECFDPVIDEQLYAQYLIAMENDDEQAINDLVDQYYAHLNTIATITSMNKADYDAYKASGTMPFDETGITELGEHNGYLYWLSFEELDVESKRQTQSETEIANWLAVAEALGDLSDMIEFIPVVKTEAVAKGEQFPAFATCDMKGNDVTDAIFAGKELTIVNFWATTCSPCINEMPELGAWARELPENVQIIGVLTDVRPGDEKKIAQVEKIMSKANADFINLMVDDALYDYYLQRMVGTPTTILVNSRGEVVGDAILGAYIEKYKEAVEAYFSGK